MPNYVEPFFGSGAVLLSRPHMPGLETVNDADGMICNVWRALAHDAETVARYADWPVSEGDLFARHLWLVDRRQALTERLMADPGYYDAQIAGWWVWGASSWIGSGWCDGSGPWRAEGGQIVKGEGGVRRKRPHLGNAGKGVHRQGDLYAYFAALQRRLRRVRVCCGDWSRITGPSVTMGHGVTAVFLDPPYSTDAGRDMGLYAHESGTVAHAVREWAIAHGDDPRCRIALCGYDTEHAMPDTWRRLAWKAQGGYGSQGNGRGRGNARREVIWFSPHCLNLRQGGLF